MVFALSRSALDPIRHLPGVRIGSSGAQWFAPGAALRPLLRQRSEAHHVAAPPLPDAV